MTKFHVYTNAYDFGTIEAESEQEARDLAALMEGLERIEPPSEIIAEKLLMTSAQVREARASLGHQFGLGRPLRAAELGRLLRLKGRDPGATVLAWEAGAPVSGPVSVALEMMLAGARPPTFEESIRKRS